MSTAKAKDIILDRISTEVFVAHNAIAVYIALSEHSQALNDLPLRRALGTVQRHALDAFILSICKLYEKRNERYPNYSIPTTLWMLQDAASDLTIGPGAHARLMNFIQMRIDPTFAVVDHSRIGCVPRIILNHFANELPRTPPRDKIKLDQILDALKVFRDKRVAHHEDASLSSLSKTNLDGARKLLAFAQTYVNIVGYGFFGFSLEGEVDVDSFEPCKSVVWPELNQMIVLLEQASRRRAERASGSGE